MIQVPSGHWDRLPAQLGALEPASAFCAVSTPSPLTSALKQGAADAGNAPFKTQMYG